MRVSDGIEGIALIGGHPALDFANSVEDRDTPEENNYLPSYEAVLRWAARVELLSATDAGRLAVAARRDSAAAARAWKDLMRLRRSMQTVFLALARHETPPAAALEHINKQVRLASARRRLQLHGDHLAWSWDRGSLELKRPQWEIVQSAAELLTSDGIGRLRNCAHEPCDWVFLDSSRGGRRRWCQMETCGNLAKLRRFRAKERMRRKGRA